MRTKKAIINSCINIVSLLITFIPNIIVRKVFLGALGNELLGLNSLYSNIIGWLSIVEMGVGATIVYSLYRPYAENNREEIRAYIRFYGKFYRSIGFTILVLGILLVPFLKFFIEGEIDLTLVIFGFILSLINSFISYIFSHKICILNVAQEVYKMTIGTTISRFVIVIIQIIMLNSYPSFINFILIQLITNLIYYIVINIYIDKKYPWLNDGNEKLKDEEKGSLLKNVKAMFIHKIGTLVVYSTDNIIISSFVGLGALANYTNYQIVISALEKIISTGLGGITASIGNLLTTGNKDKAYDVHKKIFFLNFWAVSFIVISMYNTLNQFIGIWVGEGYLLDGLTYMVILINTYFSAMRGSVEQFQSGSGKFYQDRYAPICEIIINLITSLILVKYMGIAGVFIGTLISNFTVIFWTKPYVVYKYIFNEKLSKYYKIYFKYLLISLVPLIITNFLTVNLRGRYNVLSFIYNCLINILVINILYIIIFFKTDEFKYYLNLLKSMIEKIKNNKVLDSFI